MAPQIETKSPKKGKAEAISVISPMYTVVQAKRPKCFLKADFFPVLEDFIPSSKYA